MAEQDTRHDRPDHFASAQPDAFDRAYGQVSGFSHTRPSTIVASGVLGVGGVRAYIVQTFRVPEMGDSTFVTITGPEGLQRVHLPPEVTNAIARQRDALTTKARSAAGKDRAAADKAAGILPGFMRAKVADLCDPAYTPKKRGKK